VYSSIYNSIYIVAYSSVYSSIYNSIYIVVYSSIYIVEYIAVYILHVVCPHTTSIYMFSVSSHTFGMSNAYVNSVRIRT
jgi:hypothetical protein